MTDRHRIATRVVAAALLVLVASAAVACTFGGTGGSEAELVQPAALWASPAHYQGHLVRTTGTVAGFQVGTPGEHYVVEDSTPHRVELLGVAHARLATMVGRQVAVIGRFSFKSDQGYTLQVQSIQVVD